MLESNHRDELAASVALVVRIPVSFVGINASRQNASKKTVSEHTK